MIRILHIVTSLGRAGAERQLVNVVCRTNPAIFQHTVCYLQPPDSLAQEIRNAGHQAINLNVMGRRPWLAAAIRLRPLLKSLRPSVVHTWLYDANISGRLASLWFRDYKLVTSLQCADYDSQSIQASGISANKVKVLQTIDAFTGRLTNTEFVACSRFVDRSAAEHLRISSSHMRVIYNCVDPVSLNCAPDARVEFRGSIGVPDGAIVFLNVGRLHLQKGQETLLEAFRQVLSQEPNCYLLFAGEGSLREMLDHRSRELGIEDRVQFLGLRRDIGTCYAAADVLVFPSWFEGLPVALIEALLAGLPCIASRIGPHVELIEDGETGLLIEPGGVDDLTNAMMKLCSCPAERRRLGQHAQRDNMDRFLVSTVIPEWEELYQSLV
jgi:glycosyltransferase involved in cell wall biosynthesis